MSTRFTKTLPEVIYFYAPGPGLFYGPYVKKPRHYPDENIRAFNLTEIELPKKKEKKSKV